MPATDTRPLVMHVVYRFGVGGLENGIVNLINGLPEDEFRHVVVALTECVPEFCARVTRADVEFVSLDKPPGHGWRAYPAFRRALRRYRPDIVHTRNLAALEMQVPAWAARVPVRIHGEHGRDLSDPDGRSVKYRLMRRAFSPFVTHYVALSWELERYLTHTVGIGPQRVTCIINGVDEHRFAPADVGDAGARAAGSGPVVIGTVGRLDGVKGHGVLIEAARRLAGGDFAGADGVRIRIVGDGPQRRALEDEIRSNALGGIVELAGERNDVANILREFDIFVLPSLAEGISNTILEAMATALPVVATNVGGNAELVEDGVSGALVPAGDADALAASLARYAASPELRAAHGAGGRARVDERFALSQMIERYRELYRSTFAGRQPTVASAAR